MHELRKSCDQCNRAKRKCNGECPCSRCTEKEVECTYSKRRSRTCTAYRMRRVRTLASTEEAARYRGPEDLALKRCRLSASPATGLVGMQENLFLSDFFTCVGFLPLTTETDVREAMVKIMLSSTTRAAARQDCGEEDSSGAIVAGSDFGRTFAGGELLLPMEPSTCAFWCAVAIGALVKGRATESVTKYFTLAKEALAGYAGPSNGEVAKAWAILAYLYGMAGDLPTFHRNLERSDGVLSEIAQREADEKLPVGFPEVVKHGETIKLFTGTADPEEVESFLSQEVPLPELSNIATEGEICRHMMLSYRALEQSVQEDYRLAMFWNTENEHVHVNDEALSDDAFSAESGSSSRVDAQPGGNPFNSTVRHVPAARECPGLLARMKMQNSERMGFGRLEAAADRPGIRAGVGGLVINGTLIFEKAAKGDTTGALERLGRCVDVFERYPGLHRFAMGEHMGHIMIQMAANIDDPRAGAFYQRLRCAFNVTRPPGVLRFPPLEEWQGMSAYCSNIPCRSVPKIFLGRQPQACFPRDCDRLWPVSVSQCAHQAPDASVETPEFVEQSPLGCSGAVASPDSAHSTDDDVQESDIAAEDWWEATQALGFALGVESTL